MILFFALCFVGVAIAGFTSATVMPRSVPHGAKALS